MFGAAESVLRRERCGVVFGFEFWWVSANRRNCLTVPVAVLMFERPPVPSIVTLIDMRKEC